jgi:protein required for attachment to host cells
MQSLAADEDDAYRNDSDAQENVAPIKRVLDVVERDEHEQHAEKQQDENPQPGVPRRAVHRSSHSEHETMLARRRHCGS